MLTTSDLGKFSQRETHSVEQVNAFGIFFKTYLRRERSLYGSAHCADRHLCLIGCDVSRLDVAVIHGVLEGPPSVLVTRETIEENFGPFSKSKHIDKCLRRVFILYKTNSQKKGRMGFLYLCL